MQKINIWWRRLFKGLSCRLAAVTLLTVCSSLIMGLIFNSVNIITVEDGLKTSVIRSTSTDVMEILRQNDIELDEGETAVGSGGLGNLGHISILRKVPVTLSIDGEAKDITASRGTVFSMLKQLNIEIGPFDNVSTDLYAQLYDGMQVNIFRNDFSLIEEETAIPYTIKRVYSQNVPSGEAVTVQKGEDGVKKVVTQLEYSAGKIVRTNVLSEKVIRQPVDSIIEYGTGGTYTNSRGDAVRYSYYIDVTATAYTYGDSGIYGDVTATGKPVRTGYIAVDPRVIPLGTRMYVTSPSGKLVYGYAVAEDTGGAIKGNKIDLFMETAEECKAFGRRTMRVYFVE